MLDGETCRVSNDYVQPNVAASDDGLTVFARNGMTPGKIGNHYLNCSFIQLSIEFGPKCYFVFAISTRFYSPMHRCRKYIFFRNNSCQLIANLFIDLPDDPFKNLVLTNEGSEMMVSWDLTDCFGTVRSYDVKNGTEDFLTDLGAETRSFNLSGCAELLSNYEVIAKGANDETIFSGTVDIGKIVDYLNLSQINPYLWLKR